MPQSALIFGSGQLRHLAIAHSHDRSDQLLANVQVIALDQEGFVAEKDLLV